MSIRYQCACGAEIRLPQTSAGRKAKCKSCGVIFKVPQQATARPPAPTSAARPAGHAAAEPGSWLDDLAQGESTAEGQPVVLGLPELPADPQADGPSRRAAHEGPGVGLGGADADRDWITGPKRSFWADLAASFVFFVDPENLVTFITLCLINALSSIPLIGCFLYLLLAIVNSYVQVVLLATVRETASGEDQLPSVWITSIWDDLFLPALQLAGTYVFVLLPAIALAIWSWVENEEVDFEVFNMATAWQGEGLAQAAAIMTLVGHFLWPAVVLAVAIGGTFSGLWPHVVVRTALCAPLPYLAICATIVVASLVAAIPETPQFQALVPVNSWSSAIGFSLLADSLWLYAAFVEMRAIGLYYRHYKHRLPWAAE